MSTTAPTFNATGGNPGGYISTTDPDSGDFMFSAPSKFLGNQTGAGLLSYDLNYPTGNLDYKPVDIMLTDGTTRLLWISNPTPSFGPSFTHVAINLAPSANWHLGTIGGATPTAGDFQTVLGQPHRPLHQRRIHRWPHRNAWPRQRPTQRPRTRHRSSRNPSNPCRVRPSPPPPPRRHLNVASLRYFR